MNVQSKNYRKYNMQVFKSSNNLAKRVLTALLILFSVCCLKLCAEDVTPAQAQVAREKFVAESKKYVGSPYVLGATGPDKFDCSGLVYYVARESIGMQLPRTAKALYSYCRIVPDKDKEVGDLLFFKTNNSAPITHVGIYIGNGQFISAISDGPNTGVIISSLKQDYWRPKYVGCGQFIKSGKGRGGSSDDDWEEEVVVPEGKVASSKSSSTGGSTSNFKGSSFYNPDASALEAITFDSALYCNWSFLSPNSFMLRWRGLDLQANARYSKWILEPGLGFSFRYNHGLGIFQIPILFSATVNDYLRFYAGPVLTFGDATMIDTDEDISASVFPGILGISLSTPSFNAGKTKIQIVQDISYTIFNREDNAALSFIDSVSAGLIMFTGVRVTLGMGSLLKK